MSSVLKHSGDQSKYTFFDPKNTDWPASILNVQDALAMIGPWARKDVGIKDASTTVKGIAMIATQAEVDAGTNTTKFVTPALLTYRVSKPEATESVFGTTRYANATERNDANNAVRSITPRALHGVLDTRTATESRTGTAKIATIAIARAGTEDTMIMTAKKVKAAIDALVPVQATATESVKGVVKVATLQETIDGNAREGIAVSPYAFQRANATESKYGTIKIASTSEVQAGTANNVAVTPQKLRNLTATESQYGLTKLTKTPNKSQSNLALSVNASVVPESRKVHGKALTGDISFTASDFNAYTKQESDSRYITSTTVPAGCFVRAQELTYEQLAEEKKSAEFTITAGYYPHLLVETDTYFTAWDGGIFRFVEFDVFLNNNKIGSIRCESTTDKGGSRGHSWVYRTWGHGMLDSNSSLKPGDKIRVTRKDSYADIKTIFKITASA